MSVKLVRANSDTPNIQNSDDCRLFRYACGGYDGIVKGFGNELNYEISGSNFIVKSGEFVIDGWQGKVDGSGVSIAVDNLGGIQYYVVYAEIDLSVSANQKAEIKATYNTAYYPTISRGDDLTTTPSGVARIELYRFEASSGIISNVFKKFTLIELGKVINSVNTENVKSGGTIASDVTATTQSPINSSNLVATTYFAHEIVSFLQINMYAKIRLEFSQYSVSQFTGYGIMFYDKTTLKKYWIGNIFGSRQPSGNRYNDVATCHLTDISISNYTIKKVVNGGILFHSESYDDNNETGMFINNRGDNGTNYCSYNAEDPGKDWAMNENGRIQITSFICEIE